MTSFQIVKDWVELFESALTGLGIFAAGAWAYFHFFRGRTYTPRLRLMVNGEILYGAKAPCILIAMGLENLGLSKVAIEQVGSGIRVLGHKNIPELREAEHLDSLPIFEEHEWIEPTEVVEEEVLIGVPEGDWLAFRLEMRIVSRGKSWITSKTISIHKENANALMERSAGEG